MYLVCVSFKGNCSTLENVWSRPLPVCEERKILFLFLLQIASEEGISLFIPCSSSLVELSIVLLHLLTKALPVDIVVTAIMQNKT